MGQVTWSRYLDDQPQWEQSYWWKGVLIPPYPVSARPAVGYQETTSHRTQNGVDLSLPELQQTTGSHQAFLQELRREDLAAKSSTYDNGHEFSTLKGTKVYLNPLVELRAYGDSPYGSGDLRYRGFMTPMSTTPMNYPSIEPVSDTQVRVNGARAVHRTIPTAPEAGLSQFIAELRETMPRLMGTQIYREGLSQGSIGGEHLNYQFGVAPFINDVNKLARGVLHGNKIIRQFLRDSGKLIRRRTTLERTRELIVQPSNTDGIGMGTYPWGPPYNLADQFFSNAPVTTVNDIVETAVWFAGAYTYFTPEANSFISDMELYEQKANKLLGTRLNASLIWELTPWSWLIDWFSNTGNFISNAEALSNDGLVMKYGYIMHSTKAERIYTKVGCQPNQGGSPITLTSIAKISQKTRHRASPYGFGLDVSMLNPRQWSILAALGMTRSSKSLRQG